MRDNLTIQDNLVFRFFAESLSLKYLLDINIYINAFIFKFFEIKTGVIINSKTATLFIKTTAEE